MGTLLKIWEESPRNTGRKIWEAAMRSIGEPDYFFCSEQLIVYEDIDVWPFHSAVSNHLCFITRTDVQDEN